MPKLIPITHLQHDESSLDGEDDKLKNNLISKNNNEEIKPSTSKAKELIFNQGMTLQELAECISSTIPPEQVYFIFKILLV
jgi:hypothetical protein